MLRIESVEITVEMPRRDAISEARVDLPLPTVLRYAVRTYGTPEAGTRTPYVQCVGARGQLPCASGTYSTQDGYA